MPAFPLFIDLTGRKVLVFGGGQVALRKIQTLLLFQASVEVSAPKLCEELEAMINGGTVKKAEITMNFDGEEVPSVMDVFMVICATEIAKPLHTPVQNPITRKFSELVDPTPASGLTPRYCPTITVSTIL
mgnify:CR=1 FL=1